jgi:hypothetical protein
MRQALIGAFALGVALWAVPGSAQEIVTGPRLDGMKAAGCFRFAVMPSLTVRNCIYPNDTVVWWTDVDGRAATELAYDLSDGSGLQFTQAGLDLLNLD